MFTGESLPFALAGTRLRLEGLFAVDLTDEQILEKVLALNLERAAAEKKSATPAK